jgi:tetratricopeptide (TPR) repeat protein
MPVGRESSGAEAAAGGIHYRPFIGGLMVALIFLAPLMIGTVHPWTRAIVFVGAAAALALTLADRLTWRKRFPVTVPLVALGCAFIATAIQLIPLPAGVIARLSPAAHELYSQTLGAYRWRPLTLDAGGTVAELAKLGAYFAFFAASVTYGSQPNRRRTLVAAVAGAATLVALIGLAQAALGSHELLFFYRQEQDGWIPRVVRGTFVNANHFGGLMCLGASAALVLALRVPRWRWPALAATLIINVAAMASLSRSGIGATLLGQALTYALDRLQTRRGSDWTGSGGRAAIAVILAAGVGIMVLVTAAKLEKEIDRTGLAELEQPYSKFQAWKSGAELVWDYPWTGVGRGAFDQAFTRVSHVAGQVRFPYLENSFLQVVVDWGVPVATLLALLAGWAFLVAIRRLGEDPLAIGALAGIVALAVHDVVDFSVEIPGVALPALALLSVLFSRRSSETEVGRRRIRVNHAYYLVPAALAAAVALQWWFPRAEQDGAALARKARDPGVSAAQVLASGRELRRRHPADYYLHAVVAERLARERHAETIAWLNDAIYLNPTYPATHLIAAEVLADSGRRAQAVLEYRLAASGSRNPRDVWQVMLPRFGSRDDLLAACPDDPPRLGLLAKWLISKGRYDDADLVWERAFTIDPTYVRAATELARLAVARGDAPAAAKRVAALAALDDGPLTRTLRIKERILAGDLEGAVRMADAESDRTMDALEAEFAVAEALGKVGRNDEARQRLARVEKRWLLDRAARIRLHETRAEVEHRAGNEHQYRWELEQRDRLKNP